MFLEYVFLISCIKLLLIPAYHSTDFEVHRNWLAITNSLSIKKWYFETTSEWTLDYPPLFALFEYFLSHFAKLFDPKMLIVKNVNYASNMTILFQRLSVIFTDFIFAYGCCRCCKSLDKNFQHKVELFLILFGNAGLLMVDHIHFQYNGILFGILLISIANMMENNFIASAFWFSVLLCMKHIFLYVAPAYFVYLLRHYCFLETNKNIRISWRNFSVKNFLKLGTVVSTIVVITFAPFYDQIPQVLSRLFPFKRGLCHAYWAPNFWAIYNLIDKVIILLCKKIGIKIDTFEATMTGGLVKEYSHSILPSVSPLATFLCTLIFTIPILIKLWTLTKDTKSFNFLRAICLCAAISFLFGWHVHEKAILIFIIPLSILAVNCKEDASIFYLSTIIGHYSLFPLLFPENLLYIKLLLLLLHSLLIYYSLSNIHKFSEERSVHLINMFESAYLCGFILLFFYQNYIHHILKLNNKLSFLPLLLTSAYCSLGVIYTCIKYYVYFLQIK